MTARIYQQPKNAMQSGRALTHQWVLEFDRTEKQLPDPMTGWAGSGDTKQQLRLTFASAEEAKAYAEANGIAYNLVPTPPKKLKLQSYADNFQ